MILKKDPIILAINERIIYLKTITVKIKESNDFEETNKSLYSISLDLIVDKLELKYLEELIILLLDDNEEIDYSELSGIQLYYLVLSMCNRGYQDFGAIDLLVMSLRNK